MELIIIFGIGVLMGCILTMIIFQTRSVGFLRIDTSDPDDSPYLFLELSKDIGEIYKKKYVMMKINLKSFIPHE